MSTAPVITPLWPGQRLSRDEFLRRWDALPDLKKAELIDGLVYMPSPVTADHARHDTVLITWLGVYAAATPGCRAGNNCTWMMLESAPQPDADLIILPEYGGQSGLTGRYCSGAPELVVEISVSTPSYDLGAKVALYQRAGVREYLTLTFNPPSVLWRALTEGRYVQIAPDSDGILRSRIFPGLWLDANGALDAGAARVLATLQRGIGSEPHRQFVRALAERAGS